MGQGWQRGHLEAHPMAEAMLMGDIWCESYDGFCEVRFESIEVERAVVLTTEEARKVAVVIDRIVHCDPVNGGWRRDFEYEGDGLHICSEDFSKVRFTIDGLPVVVHDYDVPELLDVLRGED